MSTATLTAIPVGSWQSMSTGQWQAHMTALTGAFDTAGFTRTSDTGQFDPASSSYSSGAYEIRSKVIDGVTWYFKFVYTDDTVTIYSGTGTNGSGSLVSQTNLAASYGTFTVDAVGTVYVSVQANSVTVINRSSGSVPYYMYQAGVVDGTPYLIGYWGSISLTRRHPLSPSTYYRVPLHFHPGGSSTSPDPANALIYRCFLFTDNSAFPQEITDACQVLTTDVANFGTFTASVYGSSATWMKIPLSGGTDGGTTSYTDYTTHLCVRWD